MIHKRQFVEMKNKVRSAEPHGHGNDVKPASSPQPKARRNKATGCSSALLKFLCSPR